MGSVADATASLGMTVQRMLPMLAGMLIQVPLTLSFGIPL